MKKYVTPKIEVIVFLYGNNIATTSGYSYDENGDNGETTGI